MFTAQTNEAEIRGENINYTYRQSGNISGSLSNDFS